MIMLLCALKYITKR